MDLDVNNYSTEELSALIGLDELTDTGIKEAIKQQKIEHPSKKSGIFFDAIGEKLLKEIAEMPVQKTIEVEVKKGTINPDLKTTITRLINVDSAYRSRINVLNRVDNFVFELSEPLLNVVSLSFYSLELPQSWYTITNLKGTDSFMLYILDTSTGFPIEAKLLVQIPEGNYTTEDLCRTVITAIQARIDKYNVDASYKFNVYMLSFPECYNHNTGVFTFKFISLSDALFPYTIQLVWYDLKYSFPEMTNNRYNYNLGWLLGCRVPLINCKFDSTVPLLYPPTGNTEEVNLYKFVPTSLVDVSGTKYIILALDDHKTNRLNRSIVSINNTPNVQITTPKYFSQDTPMYKVSPTKTNAIPSNPRSLTSKQLYTINAIVDKKIQTNLISGHESSDSFAKIPIKRTDWGKTDSTGKTVIMDIPNKLFVENGGPIQLQSREYFGPVDIYSLSVTLYDDKGNILGLNSMDWSFSMIVKCIYQY